MNPYSIFFPVIALVILTNIVVLRLAYLRRKAMLEKRANWHTFKYCPPSDQSPECMANRNLANLFEIPILFYVVAIIIFVTQKTDIFFITLAWAYVGFRYAHSFVHLTFNKIRIRFMFYLLSNVTLLTLWGRLTLILLK